MRTAVDIMKKELTHLGLTRAVLKAVTVAVLLAATATVLYLAR